MLYVRLDGLVKEENFKEDMPLCFKGIQNQIRHKSVNHNHIYYFYVILHPNSCCNTCGIS
jgi:hypothetical protein